MKSHLQNILPRFVRLSIAFVGLIACLTVAKRAQADVSGPPLIYKWSGSGYVMPKWSFNETCQVYKDKVTITRRFGREPGGFTVIENRELSITEGIMAAIKGATEERQEKRDNYLCDGPSTHIGLGVDGDDLTLFSTGGCGTPRLERQGPYSQALMNVINAYCPNTFDMGSN